MIVVFPMIPWGFLWQRPQQLLTRLAERGYPVLYLALTRDSAMHRAPIEVGNPATYTAVSLLAKSVFHLWCYTDDDMDIHHQRISPKARNSVVAGLNSFLERHAARDPYYFVQHPAWTALVEDLQAKRAGSLIYDCIDEHHDFEGAVDQAVQYEGRLIERADAVLATSSSLYEKAKKGNSNCVMLRNAADFELFSASEPNGELDVYSPNVVVGYYGSLASWFDYDLLEYLSKERPEYQFVLIGEYQEKLLSRFEQCSNLHFLGLKEYRKLPGYLASFDVCFIPFKVCPLTLATNPVKFYEFMSCGKPVVSVCLPELEAYRDICYLADDREDFLNLLDQAAKEKNSDNSGVKENRVDVARKNSWQKRVEKLDATLADLRVRTVDDFRSDLRFLGQMYQYEMARVTVRLRQDMASLLPEARTQSVEKDEYWEGVVESLKQVYQSELRAVQSEQDCVVAQTKQQWAIDVQRVRQHYERFFLVRLLTRTETFLRAIKDVIFGKKSDSLS